MKTQRLLHLLTILFFVFLNLNQIHAKSISLNIVSPRSITNVKDNQVTQLKISGVINRLTISNIFKLYPNIEELDMLNTEIVAFTDNKQVLYPANEIPKGVFIQKSKLKSIILPRGVTKIAQGAFWNCTGLEKIILPNSIQVIDKFAFQMCGKLKQITFPEALVSLGGASFAGCQSLVSVKCLSKMPPHMPEWNPFTDIDSDNFTVHVPAKSIAYYKKSPAFKAFKIKPLN